MDVEFLDMLVDELPRRGGWPDSAEYVATNGYGRVFAYWISSGLKGRDLNIIFGDEGRANRKEYESALAASKPEWDGDGLPPVGCACELVNFYGEDSPDFVGEDGEQVKIIGNGFANSCPVAFYEADGGRGGVLSYAVARCFRPIRSEVDKKKQETIFAIAELCRGSASNGHSAELIYDAIKSGNIVID